MQWAKIMIEKKEKIAKNYFSEVIEGPCNEFSEIGIIFGLNFFKVNFARNFFLYDSLGTENTLKRTQDSQFLCYRGPFVRLKERL